MDRCVIKGTSNLARHTMHNMLMRTTLTCKAVQVMLSVWKLPILLPIAFYTVFATIEGTILSATVLKVPHGAWFTLMVCIIYFAIMLLWYNSRHQLDCCQSPKLRHIACAQ